MIASFSTGENQIAQRNCIGGSPKDGELLYHYTSLDTLLKILKTRRIRFSSLRKTNDPAEYKDAEFVVYNLSNNCSVRSLEQRKERANRHLKDKWLIACLSQDGLTKTGFDTIHIQARGYAKPRMWLQYGRTKAPNGHDGCCLIFEKRVLDKEFERYAKQRSKAMFKGPVTYELQSEPTLDLDNVHFMLDFRGLSALKYKNYLQKHVERHYRKLLLSKHFDWSTESEFRFLISGNGQTHEDIGFGDGLAGVVFGEGVDLTSGDVSNEVIRQLHMEEVCLAKLRWRGASPIPEPLNLGDGWSYV